MLCEEWRGCHLQMSITLIVTFALVATALQVMTRPPPAYIILNNKAFRASQLHHTTAEQLDLCMCIGTTALGCQALYMI